MNLDNPKPTLIRLPDAILGIWYRETTFGASIDEICLGCQQWSIAQLPDGFTKNTVINPSSELNSKTTHKNA